MNIPPIGLSGSPEDDSYRSRFIQWLLHQPSLLAQPQLTNEDQIPRVVVQFWHDLRRLPDDVKGCIDSWKALAKDGFRQLLFDDDGARAFICEYYTPEHETAFDLCYHPAMRCDYFRLCYVLRNGGFYVDADEVYRGTDCSAVVKDSRIKIQPLCYDSIKEEMVRPELFLRDEVFPSPCIFYVNNNPLIAPPGHQLLSIALDRATRILLQRSGRPEIQSTTGPGNLSASLVDHAMRTRAAGREWDFAFLVDWERISTCRWALEYRKDERNWRFLNNRNS
jgi:mannosyltransferase OCH1-like enzyme